MTPAQCMVSLDWDGRRWQDFGAIVAYDEAVDIMDGSYRARRLVVELDMGSTALEMVAAGHHHATARCAVWHGSGLAYSGAVTDMTPGRAGEPTTLRLVGNELDEAAMVPSSRDVRGLQVNVAATLARQARQEARIAADIQNAYDFAGSRPLYLTVLEPGETSPKPFPAKRGLNQPVVWYIETSNVTTFAEMAEGQPYPWVFGQPGCESSKPGSRCLAITPTTPALMIAGHHGTAGTVTIQGPKAGNPEATARESFGAVNTYDDAGNPIMTVDLSGSVDLAVDWTTTEPEAADADWYAIWDGTAAGLPNGAIDVIEALLSAQSAPVDYSRIESLRGLLAGYVLDGSIDSRVGVTELLTGAILPLLPVALVDTIQGIGLAYIGLDATAADAIAPLVEGRDMDAIARPAWRGDTVTNRWTMSYAASRRSKAPTRTVTVGAQTHAAAARSVSIYGDRPGELVTGWVHRLAVAERIVADKLRRTAVDRRELVYAFDARLFGPGAAREIRPGDVYTVTDTGEALADVVAIVTSIQRDGSGTDRVRLVVV